VEFRNALWFAGGTAERTLRALADAGLSYVMVDEPQGLASSVPPIVEVTNGALAVVRLHGRRAETWEQRDITPAERFRYLYDEDELADWVPAIGDTARKTGETHVLMNNCFSNYGTTNALEIARLLAELERQASA